MTGSQTALGTRITLAVGDQGAHSEKKNPALGGGGHYGRPSWGSTKRMQKKKKKKKKKTKKKQKKKTKKKSALHITQIPTILLKQESQLGC